MKLKAYLKQSGLSVIQFAEMVGVKRAAVYRWIDGTRIPSRRHILRIREVTNDKVRLADFEPPLEIAA